MSTTTPFAPGGYRYIPTVFQYSAGVAAEPGFELERVRFRKPLPMADAFAAVEAHLRAVGRPTTAFAQCELRSPEPFDDQGFIDFNRHYVGTVERWGLYRDGVNPVARTNVCPMYDKPPAPSMYAFCYTAPAGDGAGRRGSGDHSRRGCGVHPARDEEVRRGGEVFRRQGGLKRGSAARPGVTR